MGWTEKLRSIDNPEYKAPGSRGPDDPKPYTTRRWIHVSMDPPEGDCGMKPPTEVYVEQG